VQTILDEHPEAELEVMAVWFNVIPGDARHTWVAVLLNDERVTHLWDGRGVVGNWFAKHAPALGLGERGSLLWDAYLLYGPDAVWDDIPLTVESWGAPVIVSEGELREALFEQIGPD